MTTPAYRSHASTPSTSYATTTTVVVNVPAGTAAGDYMLACINQTGLSTSAAAGTCTGWTLLIASTAALAGKPSMAVYERTATASEPASYTWTLPGAAEGTGEIISFTGARLDTVAGSAGVDYTAPSVTPATSADMLVTFIGDALSAFASGHSFAAPSGMTGLVTATGYEFGSAYQALSTGGATGTKQTATTTWVGLYDSYAVSVLLKASNSPPYAPQLQAPIAAATINLGTAQTFRWEFSDPDVDDTPSAYELRYRVVGDPTWTTTGWVSSPAQQLVIAAGTFTADDFEWQVRTKDALGEAGPWSGSEFFTAAAAPSDITITYPANGATVGAAETVTWSTPTQDAFRVRTVADLAGIADDSTIYTDSGVVEDTVSRSYEVTFDTDGRAEHIQVAERVAGLWSDWSDADALVTVAFIPPGDVDVIVTAVDAEGLIRLAITNHPGASAGTPSDPSPPVVLLDFGA